MHFGSLNSIHRVVRELTLGRRGGPAISELCRAVDLACVLYFKRVLCLQRSAATVILLRGYGWDAKMVIGAQVLPFESHAWAEIQGKVVNDKPYVRDIYRVLEIS
jgi:hypothetical protein